MSWPCSKRRRKKQGDRSHERKSGGLAQTAVPWQRRGITFGTLLGGKRRYNQQGKRRCLPWPQIPPRPPAPPQPPGTRSHFVVIALLLLALIIVAGRHWRPGWAARPFERRPRQSGSSGRREEAGFHQNALGLARGQPGCERSQPGLAHLSRRDPHQGT